MSYVNQQAAFRDKQLSARFTVKRQEVWTPVSNYENFCSTSPSFPLSVCEHEAFLIFQAEEPSKKRLGTMLSRAKHSERQSKPHKSTTIGGIGFTMQTVRPKGKRHKREQPPLTSSNVPRSNVLGTTGGSRHGVQFSNNSPKHG